MYCQLSIYGAVASWCDDLAQRIPGQNELIMEKSAANENEQVLKKPEPQEVTSWVQTPRRNDEAVRNSLRECLKKYDERSSIDESL